MELQRVSLRDAGKSRGLVVIIDVLRAFTTAAYALDAGARSITLVRDIDRAFQARRRDPQVILIGEDGSDPIDGFEFTNSPTDVRAAELTGRHIVQRTTAGTRGAVEATHADALVGGAFVTAAATARWIRARSPELVTFVITGDHDELGGDEDAALADHLTDLLTDRRPDVARHLDRVRRSDAAQRFGQVPWRPASDVELACRVDAVDRVLAIDRLADGTLEIRP